MVRVKLSVSNVFTPSNNRPIVDLTFVFMADTFVASHKARHYNEVKIFLSAYNIYLKRYYSRQNREEVSLQHNKLEVIRV